MDGDETPTPTTSDEPLRRSPTTSVPRRTVPATFVLPPRESKVRTRQQSIANNAQIDRVTPSTTVVTAVPRKSVTLTPVAATMNVMPSERPKHVKGKAVKSRRDGTNSDDGSKLKRKQRRTEGEQEPGAGGVEGEVAADDEVVDNPNQLLEAEELKRDHTSTPSCSTSPMPEKVTTATERGEDVIGSDLDPSPNNVISRPVESLHQIADDQSLSTTPTPTIGAVAKLPSPIPEVKSHSQIESVDEQFTPRATKEIGKDLKEEPTLQKQGMTSERDDACRWQDTNRDTPVDTVPVAPLVTDNTNYAPFAVNALLMVKRKPLPEQPPIAPKKKVRPEGDLSIDGPKTPLAPLLTMKEKRAAAALQNATMNSKGKRQGIFGDFDFNTERILSEREKRFAAAADTDETDRPMSAANTSSVPKASLSTSSLRASIEAMKDTLRVSNLTSPVSSTPFDDETDNANTSSPTIQVPPTAVAIVAHDHLGQVDVVGSDELAKSSLSKGRSAHGDDEAVIAPVVTEKAATHSVVAESAGPGSLSDTQPQPQSPFIEDNKAVVEDAAPQQHPLDQKPEPSVAKKKPFSAAATYPPLPPILAKAAELIPHKPKRLLPASATSTAAAPTLLSKHLVIEMANSSTNLLDRKEMGSAFGSASAPLTTVGNRFANNAMFAMPLNSANRTVSVPGELVASTIGSSKSSSLFAAILLGDHYHHKPSFEPVAADSLPSGSVGNANSTNIPYCYCARFMGLIQRSASTGLAPIPSSLKPPHSQMVLAEHADAFVRGGEGGIWEADGGPTSV